MNMLILLDIDGVMVPAKSWASPEILDDGFPAFSQKSIEALQKLISINDSLILTTSHKSYYSLEKWTEIFKNRGIEIFNIRSLPANTKNLTRKEEIESWFMLNSVSEEYIIIDDDSSLNGLSDNLKKRLILTSSHLGLTIEHVDHILLLLEKS